jgi:hypothetical protein
MTTVLLRPVSLRTIGGHTATIERIDLSNRFPLSGSHKSIGPMPAGRTRWALDGRCMRPASVLDIDPKRRAFAEVVHLAEEYGLKVPEPDISESQSNIVRFARQAKT